MTKSYEVSWLLIPSLFDFLLGTKNWCNSITNCRLFLGVKKVKRRKRLNLDYLLDF